ncbi:mediator of RNA polymerase II transcription subunit 23 [Culicoides brevitarsis]|uniref:mediator of RNA polymerase II transcription subunit 23 n=1 Tax=Culicoides brevitarsis TaxID=469753 RepID=UPI00307BFA04
MEETTTLNRASSATDSLEKRLSELAEAIKECEDDATKKESLIKQNLATVQSQSNQSIKHLFEQFNGLVLDEKVISARVLCELLLDNEQLMPDNKCLWIETFRLIKKLLQHVDYKGVREIMKNCREKAAKCFSKDLRSDELPQLNALVDVLKDIFDRNACLLPAYFIITEIQKGETFEMHWQVNHLISGYIEEFTNVAQMLSVILLPKLLPVIEHGDHLVNCWRLDPISLKFCLKGALPYCHQLTQPQTKLLRFVLEQPYSRDFVCGMLNLIKNQRGANMQLEKNLIWLIISAMERSETSQHEETIPSYWLHLSSQLIYFVLFQFATFQNIINALIAELSVKKLSKGRNQLMWMLLQYISGSIQRNPIQNFLPILDLIYLLYPEKEPLPIPDVTNPSCAQKLAAMCIWMHISRKAKLDHHEMTLSLPPVLKLQHDYLQKLISNTVTITTNNYTIPLLCNAYSTNQDYFSRPMAGLVDTISPKGSNANNNNCLSMQLLDSLTVHAKMSLIHSIVSQLIQLSKTALPHNISPGMIETYSRLLVYSEIESLGIKGFLSQLLPQVFKSHAWGILHTLLEMFSYRINFHIAAHYKVQLLAHLNALVNIQVTTQLQICIESTSLRLITGLTSYEMISQMSRFYIAEHKPSGTIVSTDNEELNRAIILTLARAINNANAGHDKTSLNWCKDMLNHVLQATPHSWSPYTYQCFPNPLKEVLTQYTGPRESTQNMKKLVDEEYRNWISLTNESEAVAQGSSSPLFLCLVFRMLLEADNVNAYVIKTVERISIRSSPMYLRNLCDYIILEITNFSGNGNAAKCIDCINKMIWTYSMFAIDSFIMKMVFRPSDNNEAQVCFYVIQSLLLKQQFRNRLVDFCQDNSPEYWKINNLERNLQFHQKHPEKFIHDEILMPVCFGNVCLRILPVLDIVIHRLIEFSTNQTIKALENILDNVGALYKYHERPITYLYNTLYYYERKLRDCPSIKKKLVTSIAMDIYSNNFPNSKKFLRASEAEETVLLQDPTYYTEVVKKVLDAIEDKNMQTTIDWRFHECPNYPTFSLYLTCIEILCLPQSPSTTTCYIIDIILKRYGNIAPGKIHSWINAIGLIIARLPEPYFTTIFDRLRDLLNSPKLADWKYKQSPFTLFNFNTAYSSMLDKTFANYLAITHALLQHFDNGQMGMMIEYINRVLKPCIKTEEQMIFLCHFICPFLNRLEAEVNRGAMDVTIMLYEILEQVDSNKKSSELKYLDPICDLLYHLKYMYIGDLLKNEIEVIIKRLSAPLRMRLRFITRLNVANVNTADEDMNK